MQCSARKISVLGVLFAGIFLSASALADIRLGLLNDFEDGTAQQWRNKQSGFNVPDGGPDGAGDNYLRALSTGEQQVPLCQNTQCGSKLVLNTEEERGIRTWLGNYFDASVGAIEVKLKNFGDIPATVRMAFTNGPGSNSTFWVTLDEITLPAQSDWQTMVFSLAKARMVKRAWVDSYEKVFSAVFKARILVNPEPDYRGEVKAHDIGFDDFVALQSAPVSNDVFSGDFE